MQVKLTKTKTGEWRGNGLGTTTASWTIVGFEHIEVFQTNRWIALNRAEGKQVAADSRQMLVQKLEAGGLEKIA